TVTMTMLNTVGNWKLYGGKFTPGAGHHLKIKNYGTSAHTAYIDEVRLYPISATMTTTAFKPFFGPGSTCSPDNYISHVEYDAFGRAMITRDMRGNITLKNEIRQD